VLLTEGIFSARLVIGIVTWTNNQMVAFTVRVIAVPNRISTSDFIT